MSSTITSIKPSPVIIQSATITNNTSVVAVKAVSLQSAGIMGNAPINVASIPTVSTTSLTDPQISSMQASPWADWMGVSAGFWATIGTSVTPLKQARLFVSEDGVNFTKMGEHNFEANDITSQWIGFNPQLTKAAQEHSYYFELENTDGVITKSATNTFTTSDLAPRFGADDLQITVGSSYVGATAVAWCYEPGKDLPSISGEIWVSTDGANFTKLDIPATRDNATGVVQFSLNDTTPGLTLTPGQTYFAKVIIKDAQGQTATSKTSSFKITDFAPAFGQDGVQILVSKDYPEATIMAYTQEQGKTNPNITAKLLIGDSASSLTELPITATRDANGMVIFNVGSNTPGLNLLAGQTKYCKLQITDGEGQVATSPLTSFTTADFAPGFGQDGVTTQVWADSVGATVMAYTQEQGKINPNITAKILIGDSESNLTQLALSSTRDANGMVTFNLDSNTPGLNLKAGQTKVCKIQITDAQGQVTTSAATSFTTTDFAPSFGQDGVQVQPWKDFLGVTLMAYTQEAGKDNPAITAKLFMGEDQSNLIELSLSSTRDANGMVIFNVDDKTAGVNLQEAKNYFAKIQISDAQGQVTTSAVKAFATSTYSPQIAQKDVTLTPKDAQGVEFVVKVPRAVQTSTLLWGTSPDSLTNTKQTIPTATGEVRFNLNGLDKNTQYYYKLSVKDTNNRQGELTGNFNIDSLVVTPPTTVSAKPVGYYSNGELKLSYSLANAGNVTVSVLDLFSKRVLQQKLSEGAAGTSVGKNVVSLPIGELNAGAHAYIIDANGVRQTGRFMVN